MIVSSQPAAGFFSSCCCVTKTKKESTALDTWSTNRLIIQQERGHLNTLSTQQHFKSLASGAEVRLGLKEPHLCSLRTPEATAA